MAAIEPLGPLSLLRYRHLPLPRAARRRCARSRPAGRDRRTTTRRSGRCCAVSAHRRADRPLLGRLRPAGAQPAARDEASAAMGVFTVARRCSGERGSRPDPSGAAARRDARRRGRSGAGGRRRDGADGRRVDSLDDLDADAVVVAVPPAEAARLLGEAEPGARGLADRQRPPALRPAAARHAARRAARLARALGLRPRRAHRPSTGARPVPDRRLERRARAAGGPRQAGSST